MQSKLVINIESFKVMHLFSFLKKGEKRSMQVELSYTGVNTIHIDSWYFHHFFKTALLEPMNSGFGGC